MQYQQELSTKPPSHGERIQTSIFVNSGVMTVLSEKAAVDQFVEILWESPRQTVNGTEVIALVYVVVVLICRGALVGMLLRKIVKRKVIPINLMIFFPDHNTRTGLMERISGVDLLE